MALTVMTEVSCVELPAQKWMSIEHCWKDSIVTALLVFLDEYR